MQGPELLPWERHTSNYHIAYSRWGLSASLFLWRWWAWKWRFLRRIACKSCLRIQITEYDMESAIFTLNHQRHSIGLACTFAPSKNNAHAHKPVPVHWCRSNREFCMYIACFNDGDQFCRSCLDWDVCWSRRWKSRALRRNRQIGWLTRSGDSH